MKNNPNNRNTGRTPVLHATDDEATANRTYGDCICCPLLGVLVLKSLVFFNKCLSFGNVRPSPLGIAGAPGWTALLGVMSHKKTREA